MGIKRRWRGLHRRFSRWRSSTLRRWCGLIKDRREMKAASSTAIHPLIVCPPNTIPICSFDRAPGSWTRRRSACRRPLIHGAAGLPVPRASCDTGFWQWEHLRSSGLFMPEADGLHSGISDLILICKDDLAIKKGNYIDYWGFKMGDGLIS